MHDAGYVSALLLAGVLVWAAAAKLRSPGATAAGFAGMGLPASQALAWSVPGVELLTAAALVLVPVAGAVVALVLLIAFTAVLGRAVVRGATTGCNCFGAPARPEPPSPVHFVRNGILAAAAVMATGGEASVPSLPAVIGVTTVAALAAVSLAVLEMRLRVGRVWSNKLPGEGGM